ncbi:H(+)/Cl(-) exchange transporter 3 [Cyphellophora attinorum]|uniref:Chloride channel protein n=1 Tax=Cyphellophora attinorum TaxID=1664694 RepID=A0A0N1HXT1_9EURO|nr:H(+)/Cl(-) exchange transporter 3 [Phialophora attinorum]KPI45456.1 H(+)/Cl(-) exchange transporter 3 [Phialophora attinorum]
MAGSSRNFFDQSDYDSGLLHEDDTGDLSIGQIPSVAPVKAAAFEPTETTTRHRRNGTSDGFSHTQHHNPDSDNKDVPTDSYIDSYPTFHRTGAGYDDLSAIDWIFEYAKERARLKRLLTTSSHGLTRALKQLADASHVWVVLVLTGVSVGFLAAAISIASDWLGDIKLGYCKTDLDTAGGGGFYMSRQFCCWGHNDLAECVDWTPWRKAMGLSNAGVGYTIEFILFVCFAIVFALSAALLVKSYSPYAKSSGIPEIKTLLGGFVIRRFLGGWTLLTKSLGLCLAVSSGLWVGKEGPLVHVACCCANIIMKPFSTLSQNEARKREVLSAASAAGISVAFGAPIGGVLFSLEQLSYYFPDKTMWQSFVCAMVAAVSLQALNPFHTGKIVLFQVTHSSDWHSFELLPFVLLGIIGGLYGGLFIHLNMAVTRFRRSEHNPLRDKQLMEVLLIAAVSAVVNFPNIFMRAQLPELLNTLFSDCAVTGNTDSFGLCRATAAGSFSMTSLLITAAGLGFLLAAITLGLPIPAGIILPSLAIGALSGRAVGIAVEMLHRHLPTSIIFSACEPDTACVIPGTYAIVGAAASLAGVTRLTVSIVVIMFELTGALSYVLPIMIAVMLAKWIGDAISQRGIYEAWIYLNEYPYLDNKDDTKIPHVPVSNVMTELADMTCFDASRTYTVGTLQAILEKAGNGKGKGKAFGPAAAARNVLLGYISRTELAFALEYAVVAQRDASNTNTRKDIECYFRQPKNRTDLTNSLDLRPWMDHTPITLHVNSTFQLAVSMFQSLGLRNLLLVDRGAFKGILTKKDVWWILNASEDARKNQRFVAGTGVLREQPIREDDGPEGDVKLATGGTRRLGAC